MKNIIFSAMLLVSSVSFAQVGENLDRPECTCQTCLAQGKCVDNRANSERTLKDLNARKPSANSGKKKATATGQ